MDNFEDMNISENDIQEASKTTNFLNFGDVKLDEFEKYVEFDTKTLLKFLMPFKQKKSVSKDIISRSLYIERISPSEVSLKSTDGVSHLSAILSVKINGDFPTTCLIDMESFYSVCKSHSKKSYLIYKDFRYYSNFYGGSMFIPSYGIDTKIFNKVFGNPINRCSLNSSKLISCIKSSTPVISSSNISELCYIFMMGEGEYASNGVIVSKTIYSMPRFTLRYSDVNTVLSMLDIIQCEQCFLNEYENSYEISGISFKYVFPKINSTISNGYRNVFFNPENVHEINLPMFMDIVSILTVMPDSSGIISLKFNDGGIIGEIRNRKGDISNFNLSSTKIEGIKNNDITISIKAISIILRIFKEENYISLSYKDDKIMFYSKDKYCVLLLKKN
jgi:hypothetical protein